jgi:hypothetical protein
VADVNAEPLLHPAVNAVNMASTSPTVGVAGQISGHTMNGASGSAGFSPQGGIALQDDPAIEYSLAFVHDKCKCTRSCLPVPPSLAPLSQEPLTKTDAQLVAETCGRAIQRAQPRCQLRRCPARLIAARLPLLRKPFGPSIVSFT